MRANSGKLGAYPATYRKYSRRNCYHACSSHHRHRSEENERHRRISARNRSRETCKSTASRPSKAFFNHKQDTSYHNNCHKNDCFVIDKYSYVQPPWLSRPRTSVIESRMSQSRLGRLRLHLRPNSPSSTSRATSANTGTTARDAR